MIRTVILFNAMDGVDVKASTSAQVSKWSVESFVRVLWDVARRGMKDVTGQHPRYADRRAREGKVLTACDISEM